MPEIGIAKEKAAETQGKEGTYDHFGHRPGVRDRWLGRRKI